MNIRASRQNGFSLIELMIVVAVIGILAAVAMPSYREYVKKGYRSAAKSYLLELSNKQTQYFLDARTYAGSLAALGVPDTAIPPEVFDNYTVTTVPDLTTTPLSYYVRADPKVGSKMAGDVQLQVNSDGTKTPAAYW